MSVPTKLEIADATYNELAEARSTVMPQVTQWTLVETLFWIGLRDFTRVAWYAVRWEDTWEEWGFRGGNFREMVNTALESESGVVVAKPWVALLPFLKDGRVVATGVRNGVEDRATIDAQQWIDLEFSDDKRTRINTAGASQKGRQDGVFWDDIRFASEGVAASFPLGGTVAVAIVGTTNAVEKTQPWHRNHLEGIKEWIGRPDVWAEAERRVSISPNRQAGMGSVLGAMHDECGGRGARSSVERIYREYFSVISKGG